MRKLFQNVAVFYGSLVLAALVLQWFVADAYKAEIQAMDKSAMRPLEQMQEHYGKPAGVPVGKLSGDLNVIEKKIHDGFKKLQDLINFKSNPEYRIEAKAAYPQVEFQERITRFKTKNAKRLKALQGKFSPAFLSLTQDLTIEKANDLLFQASILEEFLARLEASGSFSHIDTISASPPRTEPYAPAGKMLSKVIRFPIVVELTAGLSSLDEFFAGLQTGKGYFFLEDLELQHANDPELWGERVRCKATFTALYLEAEKQIEFQPVQPAWAAGLGR